MAGSPYLVALLFFLAGAAGVGNANSPTSTDVPDAPRNESRVNRVALFARQRVCYAGESFWRRARCITKVERLFLDAA